MVFKKTGQGNKPFKKKKTGDTPPPITKVKTPNRSELEMYGKVIQLMGSNQVKVACEDGQDRICRIPGKLFKHVWLKSNDIVIVKLWDFQPTKADVVWRYLGYQKSFLEKKGELTKLYDYTHDDIFKPEEKEIKEDNDNDNNDNDDNDNEEDDDDNDNNDNDDNDDDNDNNDNDNEEDDDDDNDDEDYE